MKRRKFLKTASAAGLGLVASPRFPSWLKSPGETVRVAVMGLNGRGTVQAQRKHQRVVQMGTQQRSAPRSIEVVQAIKEGAIGQPYLARAWYANTRATIGRGKVVPVPANLDYELWQGPAPHTPYRDNVVHYNW